MKNKTLISAALKTAACVAVIAAVSLAFFWPDAIEGHTLQQHDMQQGMANGRELADYRAATGESAWWTNSLFGGMPAFQISPSYGSSGMFSWLNRVYGLFLPGPSNLIAMMMLGMFILLMAMKTGRAPALLGAIAWGLSSYFVIIIGAGHIWKFITLSYVPPTIAGLVMIYRGRRLAGAGVAALFMALQIAGNHVQMSYYFAWVMAGFVAAYAVEAWRGRRWRSWLASTAVAAGAMLLAAGANMPNLYNTYEYSKETMRGRHSELTPPAGAAAAATTDGLDREYITMYSYGRGETLSLLIPDIQGGASAKPVKGQMAPLQLSDTDEGRALSRRGGEMVLLQLFSQYFGGAEGTNGPVYVGAIIVALFIFGAITVRGPLKWALVALTALSILLAWGRNLQWFTDLFIDWMPLYSKFRTPESILVIAEFTMPLLGVMGLHRLLTADAATRRQMLRPLLWSFGPCMAICLIGIVAPGFFGSAVLGERDMATISQYIAYGMLPEDFNPAAYPAVLEAAEGMRLEMVSSDALRSFLFLGIGLVPLALLARGSVKAPIAVGVVTVAVLVDLYGADKRYVDSGSFTTVAPQEAPFSPSAADRAILADSDPHYRVLDVNNFGSAAPSYFHKSIGGYHAAKLTRYQDLIDRHLAYAARPEITGLMELRSDSVAAAYDPADVKWLRSHLHVLDMLNTKYIITGADSAPLVNPGALGNAWFVDEVAYVEGADAEMAALEDIDPGRQAVADAEFRAILGAGRSAAAGDTIALTSYAPDRLTYRATSAAGGTAVFSEVYFPWGWKATIDGVETPIARVDYLLRAINVPAGTHEIVMSFRPESVRVTDGIAYACVVLVYLLLAAGIIVTAVRRRKS